MNIRNLDWFYAENVQKGVIRLSSDESRHIKVKRHYENEKVAVFDGKGKVGAGKIISKPNFGKAKMGPSDRGQIGDEIEIFEVHEFPKEESLTIAVAVPKGDRLDFMLQKLTELNVSTIMLMNTKRSIVMPRETKQERLKRILI
ncbi:MAG: 16S rRNA (uracil(1498)-N(3))-methyltransferase, partial [Nanoarchaeota archaeon]